MSLKNEIGKYFTMNPWSVEPPKYISWMIHATDHAWKWIQGLGLQLVALFPSCREECGGIPCNQGAQATVQSTHTNPDLITTRDWYHVRVKHRWLCILLIDYWHRMLDVRDGRVDISLELSMFSSHLDFPREVHLQKIFHMFTYLKRNHNSEMAFDPSNPVIDESLYDRNYWTAS